VNTVKFECQLTTPMFMAGANQKLAELRAPSIKGLLRWWFRAAHVNLHLDDIAKKEADFFGSIEKTSAVKVRISFDERGIESWIGNDIKTDEGLNFEPSKDSKDKRITGNDSGIGFLFYSTLLRKDKSGEVKQQRGYFKPGFRFILELSSNKKEALKSATEAFWLLSFLGGMGSRSRRGAGNFCIIHSEGELNMAGMPQFLPQATAAEELKSFLQTGVEIIRPKSITATGFTSLGRADIVLVNKTFSTWKDALNEIGAKYEAYRFSIRKKFGAGAAFGMPIMHDSGNMKVVPAIPKTERFASPLHFKVWKSGDHYFGGFVCLDSNLYSGTVKVATKRKFPKNGKTKWSGNGESCDVSKSSVNDFIKTFREKEVLQISIGKI
jgi:CRISPR-associated protein Cmr1